MDNKELKEKLKVKVEQLKGICVDAKFADSLIDDILSLKGQIDVEPTRLAVKENDVKNEFKGNHFYIARTDNEIVFHVYGGYTIVVNTPLRKEADLDIIENRGFASLYETLNYYIETQDKLDELPEDERELYDTILSAVTYILEIPTYVFSNPEFMLDMASKCVDFLKSTYENTMKEIEENGIPNDDAAENNAMESILKEDDE